MTYLDELTMAIERNHGCAAHLEEFVPVTVVHMGGIAWEGDVGIFLLDGHPKARLCYAWGVPSDDEAKSREVTTILGIAPVTSAEAAVRKAIETRAGLN
jgi:hypothetical protein